ncbi:MAG: T9SS type A sorting domain-containing protein, partial [Owenweeksia sp.]
NINLTRNNASFSTVNISACQEYISPSGRYTWKANGTYTDTISNAVGCDSIMTINLSLLNNSSLINQLVVCKRYTSPSGQYTWTASGTYSDTVTNIHGCDSVITINLTVKNVDTLVTQAGVTLTAKAGFATFQWLNCDLNYAIIPGETQQSFTPQVNGSYAVRITQAGCTDTSGCKSINNVELQDAFNSIPFVSLYPNPTSGKVILELDRAYYKTQITVQSINGQKISSGSYDGQQKIELQLGTESGIFIIQIQLEEYDPIQLKVSKI